MRVAHSSHLVRPKTQSLIANSYHDPLTPNYVFMANAAGPSIGQSETAPHQASPSSDDELGFRIPSRSQAILSLIGYEDLYSDINNHLAGDVRHRFLDIRAKRARYVEGLVIFRANTLATLEHDVRMRKVDPSTEDFVNSYDAAMEALGEALSRLSTSNASLCTWLLALTYLKQVIPTATTLRWLMRHLSNVTTWTTCIDIPWRWPEGVQELQMASCGPHTDPGESMFHRI